MMGKVNFSAVMKSLARTVKKHSPEILTGVGIAGMIATVVTAVKATPKAVKLIEQKKQQTVADKLTTIETVKTTWKCYIPTAVVGVLSIACIVGASAVNHKRNAALLAAYGLTETAFKEYKNKVVEVIGDKKEQEVNDKIAKEHIDKKPVSESQIIETGHGEVLCYEPLSGRYFKSDVETLRQAENTINKKMLNYDTVSLNDFYDEIGLDNIDMGEYMGWDIAATGYIELKFSSHLTADGMPCLVVGHDTPPRYGYDTEF